MQYHAYATVLQERDDAPMLCLGIILASYPPQCGDVPIASWSWDAVDGEERAYGTTWGEYRVVGRYDGKTFTVEEVEPAGAPPPPADDPDEFAPPCTGPTGGWGVVEPARVSQRAFDAAHAYAERQPDSAGTWIAYIEQPTEDSEAAAIRAANFILVAAFTRDLERYEAELRELWGGALCVVRFERTQRELRRIQRDVERTAAKLGLKMLATADSVTENAVELEVVAIDDEQRRALETRYGAGVVQVEAALEPVG